jgi:integrase
MKNDSWQKTRYANLVRYVSSGTYFIRAKVNGKLIRETLDTDVETVARLKLADRLKELRNQSVINSAAKMTFGEAAELFKARIQQGKSIGSRRSKVLKPRSQEYRLETLQSILRSWPGLDTTEIKRIDKKGCEHWAEKYAKEYSPTRYNGSLETLRAVFDVAIEEGAIAFNPVKGISRASVKQKALKLPTHDQFLKLLAIMDQRDTLSPGAADLVRLLAFSGMRASEVRNFVWTDVDFDKRQFTVRGDPEYGTKNSEIRFVPMIEDLRTLLMRLQAKGGEGRVLSLDTCRYSLAYGCEAVGCSKITHHDLRHLFATRCIESGVDIPTVSRWLGHKDGGALAMKTYGHLRDDHSTAMAQRVSFSAPTASSPGNISQAA